MIDSFSLGSAPRYGGADRLVLPSPTVPQEYQESQAVASFFPPGRGAPSLLAADPR